MSDIEFDPDEIGRLPSRLHQQQSALLGATTLPAPDTGATTTATRDATGHLTVVTESLAAEVADLADGVRRCVDLYDASDGTVGWWLESRMIGAIT